MNNNVLIIGAGELGSRHLQGILKVNRQLNVYCVDPSEKSLKIAKNRADEITSNSNVSYSKSLDFIPVNQFDVVIISTSSHVREQIIIQLLEKCQATFLILEKVLFQEIKSYHNISKILSENNVKVWVNHPRRMVDKYKEIRRVIINNDEKIVFNVIGGNWGLACNGLHFLDLFTFLTGDEIESIESNELDNIVHPSKRAHYIEFTGTLNGKSKKGHQFHITSFQENIAPISIYIASSSARWNILEGHDARVSSMSRENGFLDEEEKFIIDFQSSLTTEMILNLYNNNECDLPSYYEASNTHIAFIESLLKKYRQITNIDTDACPIT